MDSKLPILNAILVLSGLTFGTLAVKPWLLPEYSPMVKPAGKTSQKPLERVGLDRRGYSSNVVANTANNNIFRRQRTGFRKPTPVVQVAKALVPPPKIKLKGIMFLNGTKIAFMEGKYSVRSGQAVQQKPVKKKGYKLGENIGDYRITRIDKNTVTLDTKSGSQMTVKLNNRSPTQIIKRSSGKLFHSIKKKKAGSPAQTAPPPVKVHKQKTVKVAPKKIKPVPGKAKLKPKKKTGEPKKKSTKPEAKKQDAKKPVPIIDNHVSGN